jgi:protein-L-isoaspartate(D-aspartate) O-methyltransferase
MGEVHGIGMTSQRTRTRLVDRLRDQGIQDTKVLDAIRTTPRHLFVEEALAQRAYEDTALPIGYGQTISQPYVVARMTEAIISGGPPKRVLEVGTGSGYQAAILSQLCDEVYSIERVLPLYERSRRLLRQLSYHNVRVRYDDRLNAWEDMGPFDAIVVTAAPSAVPEILLHQLADGGRCVIPVGDQAQQLCLITRQGDKFNKITLDHVRFVPLLPGKV